MQCFYIRAFRDVSKLYLQQLQQIQTPEVFRLSFSHQRSSNKKQTELTPQPITLFSFKSYQVQKGDFIISLTSFNRLPVHHSHPNLCCSTEPPQGGGNTQRCLPCTVAEGPQLSAGTSCTDPRAGSAPVPPSAGPCLKQGAQRSALTHIRSPQPRGPPFRKKGADNTKDAIASSRST